MGEGIREAVASNPAWSPNTPVAASKVIVDSNGNIQQWSSTPGSTGAILPVWGNVLGAFTADGSGGWTCVAMLETVNLPTGIVSLPIPNFLTDTDGLDPNTILNDMIATFQNLTNRTLYPAQVERLLIDDYAYRESLVRNQIQYAGMQCLLAFSSYPMIDYIGQLVGVARLSAQGASCTLQFTLTAALPNGFTIPAGTLIGTQDGAFVFATQSDLTILPSATTGTIFAVCTTPSDGANGYAIGQVSVQINPNSLIASVTNTTVTSGGGDVETDDHLRSRIQQAPNRFSVAGPSGAYRFWALSADPSIIDVSVTTPVPGTVDVWVLVGPVTQPANAPNGAAIASGALLNKVFNIINAESVRPLTDTVNALAVTEVDYTVAGTVTLFSDADPATTMAAANAAAQQLTQNNASRIQRDIVPEEFIAAIGSAPGVYRVVLSSPTYQQLTAGQWSNCTNITLSQVVGSEHS
jgi:phage-related baseplate assembly protein